jgi:hypothetical protein
MNTLAKALLIALAIEVVAAGFFAFGGFGPCGPSNPLGFVGTIAHLPGLFAAWPVNSLLPNAWVNSVGWLVVAIAQWLIDAAIVYAYLTYRSRPQGGRHAL